MKPVAIFRHFPIEGPGYLAPFLDSHSIPYQLVKVDSNEALPTRANYFSGLVFMGGPMSVNDDLPWIAPALALIRQAVTHNIPVLGHCLGGQLMAKALGGVVSRSPVSEIGWGRVNVADNPIARDWFGELSSFEAFHWHGEGFTIPEGAALLLSSPHCENQAFAMGTHLALQCHVEMTEEMVKAWCKAGAEEIYNNPGPSVQSAEAIQTGLTERVSVLNQVACRLYERWISGLMNTTTG
ncbi:GMP synthase-Glutamine amidotransferase [Nitrosospira sp. Nsp18]|uniref:type 1 glutamine amidotransferase n=1 Tax=Nitrosospira sp. Nsp18 TaxID=1855334 RepID=UPI0008827F4C|nr:type 1 glutamine amidotransferase [Nitrosospira sp. Nsp18]SDA26748.1 GMP synthase-Glutamine amidotransferase [Nitrosospira sp. Nsp18]